MLCPRALQQKEAAVAGGSAPSSPEQVHTHPGEELKCTSTECWQIHAMPGMLHPAALSPSPFPHWQPHETVLKQMWMGSGSGCSNHGMWWGRDKLVSFRARHGEERPGLTAQQRGRGSLQEGQGRVLKIWSWSRTTQTWNDLTKTKPSLWPRELPQF